VTRRPQGRIEVLVGHARHFLSIGKNFGVILFKLKSILFYFKIVKKNSQKNIKTWHGGGKISLEGHSLATPEIEHGFDRKSNINNRHFVANFFCTLTGILTT